jgi:hypothetical protein
MKDEEIVFSLHVCVSRHLSPTSPFAGLSTISIFSIPLMIVAAFAISVIAAQIAGVDPLTVTCASTITMFLQAGSRCVNQVGRFLAVTCMLFSGGVQ